jgi:hypothetical protein
MTHFMKIWKVFPFSKHACRERQYRPGKQSRVQGRDIAQAVSRWLPTAAARVQTWVWSSGIFGGQSVAGAGFLRTIRYPLPIFILTNSPSS